MDSPVSLPAHGGGSTYNIVLCLCNYHVPRDTSAPCTTGNTLGIPSALPWRHTVAVAVSPI